ncbi:MAG: hypothetical protein RJB38_219 [Pseudomonadota bacterium]|jgi:type II secretion system protein N
MTTDETLTTTTSLTISPTKKLLRGTGWILTFLVFFAIFTALKLPDGKVGALLLEKASKAISSPERRIELTADKTHLPWFILGTLRFEGLKATTTSADGVPMTIRWKDLSISPSFFSLFLGRLGGTIQVSGAKSGSIEASFYTSRGGKFSFESRIKSADLGADGLGLLPLLTGLAIKLPVDGQISLEGSFEDTASLTGDLELALGKTELQAQKISGFPIPAIRIQDGNVKITIANGSATLKTFRLGNMNQGVDDLAGSATGTISIGKPIEFSQLNVSTRFKLSEAVIKGLFIIDAILAPGKEPDGSYHLSLQGPMTALQMLPGKETL